MIRILHFVHALTRGGGLTTLIMNYYRQIDRSKIQFDFVYFKEVESDFKDEITSLGGKFYKFTEPSFDFSYKKECEKFFEEHKGEYSAIHCHVLFSAAFYGGIAKKYGIKNIIVHSHSASYGSGLLRKARNYYFVKKADHIATHRLACSDDAARFMFGNKGNAKVISNAIDCAKYLFDENIRKEVREELNVTNEFVIGHVGGFVPLKNHTFLVDVFNEIVKKRPESALLLIGGEGTAVASTKEYIEEKVKILGLQDKVKFLGIRSDVNRLMMAMDFFVLPSTVEGFGLVLVEAQASGLYSLASTNVPEEAKCSELVSYLPLEAGAGAWADEILSANINGERLVDASLYNRFNIEKQKTILENLYMDM